MSIRVIAIIIILCAALTVTANAELYPKITRIIELDYENNIVTVEDSMYFTWEFYGCGTLKTGDVMLMLMDNINTDYILDDAIVLKAFIGLHTNYIEDLTD